MVLVGSAALGTDREDELSGCGVVALTLFLMKFPQL